MKKALIIFLALFLITGCETVRYITPAVPDYKPVLPERPELYEIEETADIPKEVNINTVLLMGYAESLEMIIENWERFYNELTKLYQVDRKTGE